MHMLVENATSAWGQSREWVLHKHSCIQFIALVPSALVLWTVCTCACAKPIPEIVPMLKLDICAYDHPAMSNKSYRFLTLSATQCSASQLKLYNFCMETDSYFTYSMPAQLWCRGRIALAQNNQAKFCVFRCNQEDSSRSSFFHAAHFTIHSMSNLDFFPLAKGNIHIGLVKVTELCLIVLC